MSEIRKCPDCGEPRYAQGKGSHVETGLAECERELTFYPCLADGTVVEPVDGGPWQGKLYACAKCGRIIDQESLAVTGIIGESTR